MSGTRQEKARHLRSRRKAKPLKQRVPARIGDDTKAVKRDESEDRNFLRCVALEALEAIPGRPRIGWTANSRYVGRPLLSFAPRLGSVLLC